MASCTSSSDKNETKIKTSLPVQKSNFQTEIEGRQTDLFVLQNQQGMKVGITNYGGRIVSWLAPDKNGEYDDIVLGFDSIDGYLNANEVYFGALIGRYGNRIQKGQFSLNGETYSLATNNGQNHLHGGPGGFHNVVWDASQLDDQHLVLTYFSEDGEEGYPGNLSVKVKYTLTPQNELKIDYTATTDSPTPINLTNHAFFNLGGAASGTINEHELTIYGSKYTPVDSTLIPTGEMTAVEGTPFDFTSSKAIGEDLSADNTQLEYGQGYDHNFILDKEQPGKLTQAAKVTDPASGRTMEVFTTEPGIQFYGGNFLDGSDTGKEGQPYTHRTAFCLETQHFPDSPNHPDFPSTVLNPGEIYHSLSIYKFSTE
nr:aldose epimerase family protein [Rhodohalobacter sp. 614A]